MGHTGERRAHCIDDGVTIIGAGPGGLAAANRLMEAGYLVRILERADWIGGRVRAAEVCGVTLDVGAQFVADFYSETISLIGRLGLSQLLVKRKRATFVALNGAFVQINPPADMIKGREFSLRSRVNLLELRALLSVGQHRLDISRLDRAGKLDGSAIIASLRRLGMSSEVIDCIVGPFIRSLVYSELDETSTALALAILRAFVGRDGETSTMRGGLTKFTDALAENTPIATRTEVKQIRKAVGGGYELICGDGSGGTFFARAVVIATPADDAAQLLRLIEPEVTHDLRRITYSSTHVILISMDSEELSTPGTVLFPTSSKLVSSISPAPIQVAGQQFFRLYLTNHGSRSVQDMTTRGIARTISSHLHTELGGPGGQFRSIQVHHIQRWERALPRFPVGHLANVAVIRERIAKHRGLAVAGDYLDGPYIDGAVRSGFRAADQISARLGRESPM